MDEIDAMLADERFCQSLLPEGVDVSAFEELTAEPLESLTVLGDLSFDEANGNIQFLDTFDKLMNSDDAAGLCESVDSSLAESHSGNDIASIDDMLQIEHLQTTSYVLNQSAVPSVSNSSGSEASPKSYNSDSFEEHLEVAFEDFDQDSSNGTDDSDEDDADDSATQVRGKRKQAKTNRPKKPPLFQPLRSTGELKLTDLEKQTLQQEGMSIQTRLPLSKHDERILKQVRRKIRNKISAQESRRKKRAYVDELESHLKHAERENRELRAQLKQRSDALQKATRRFNTLRSFISSHIRFDVPSLPLITTSKTGNVQGAALQNQSKPFAFGLHQRPTVMALFLCFAVLVGCRPGALSTVGFFFGSSETSTNETLVYRSISNVSSNAGCQIALIAYSCGSGGAAQSESNANSDQLAIEEYYFDGRSFLDRNAASMRTLKRFADQSNVFGDASAASTYRDAQSTSYARSVDSLLNVLRYSTARTLLRRTVSATSEKLAAKLKHRGASKQSVPQQQSTTTAQDGLQHAPSNPESNGKLLDQRAAPARPSLFKWSMNQTTNVVGWWNKVIRTFVDEPCCSSHLY